MTANNSSKAWVGPALYIGAFATIVLFVMMRSSGVVPGPDPLHTPNTSYKHAFLVAEGDQTLISLVFDDEPTMVATLDSRTGELVAMGPVCPNMDKGRITIHQPQNEWLWVSCGLDDFTLLDLTTAKPVLTRATAASEHPEVAAGIRLGHPHVSHDVEAPTHELRVQLHDGRSAYIGLDGSFSFEPTTPSPWQPGYFCWPGNACSTERRECVSLPPSPSGQGMVLTSNKIHGERKRPSTPISEWPASLLRPGFVLQPTNRCAFEEDDSYLLLHDSAAFEPKESLLSLVARDGTIHWTRRAAELGAAEGYEPRRAQRVGDEVIVFSTNESHRKHLTVTWLDLETGEVHSAQQLFGAP